MKRVVLYGGSFDPIHYGHLEIAKRCIKARSADELWFMVSKQSPFKTNSTPFHHRYKMVKLMTSYHRKMRVSDIENTLPEPSYTVDTIQKLQSMYPNICFELLIGPDQIESLHKWKNWDEIEKRVTVICYNCPKNDYKIINVKGPSFNVRSTLIREGCSLQTSPKVISYMTKHSLYTKEWLEHRLSEFRFQHVLRVNDLALELRDNEDVKLAALFHDFTKELDIEKQIALMKGTGYSLDRPTYFYHAFTAASVLAKHYYVKDKKVLKAIRGHVNGDCLNEIGKTLYIADKCERGRKYNSEPFIELAKENLDMGFKACLISQEEYVKGEN